MSGTNIGGIPAIEKLKGRQNYAGWKFAMKHALQLDGLWKAVEGTETDADKVTRAMAKLVLCIDEINYVHIKDAANAKEVWTRLKSAFEDNGLTRKVTLLRKMSTTKLENCESIDVYINEIISTSHQLSDVGFNVDDEWLGAVLLAGLPERYEPMIMALENSGIAITGDLVKTKLLQELRITNSKDEKAESSAFHARKQQKDFHSRSKAPKCYTCGKPGHYARNCRTNSNTKKKNFDKTDENKKKKENTKEKDETSTVAFLTKEIDKGSKPKITGWIIDSAASSHMTANRNILEDFDDCIDSRVVIADDAKLNVKGRGKVNIPLIVQGKRTMVPAEKVLYVPELHVNLLSVSQMTKKGLTVSFDHDKCEIFNKAHKVVATAEAKDNIYWLSQPEDKAYTCRTSDETFLWHRRLGHLNRTSMKLLRDKHAEGLEFEDPDDKPCITCAKGKHARQPFIAGNEKRRKRTQPLQLIHTDICGPMETVSIGGSRYFITFIDDYTRKISIYFLKHKNEALDAFKDYKNYVEKQIGKHILILRSDNGTEFVNREFEKFLRNEGIKHETSIPYCPQQNGLAERANRTIVEKARCMLQDAKMEKTFWAEACNTAVYLINRSPARSLQHKTPYEMWSGYKPNLRHLKIFGSKASAHVPKEMRRKLDEKSKECKFLGYLENSKGYRLFDSETQKVFKSRDVIFFEDEVDTQDSDSAIPITAIEDDRNGLSSDEEEENEDESEDSEYFDISSTSKSSDDDNKHNDEATSKPLTSNVRRSERKPKPRKMNDFIMYSAITEESEDCPETFEDALKGSERSEWQKAMQEEYDALIENETWTLCERPSHKKVLKSRWVYRKKSDTQNSEQRFKARLVVKGYEQERGIDYQETYSPVVRFETIRSLMATAAKHDFDLDHLDVVTAFLNGDLNEEIYMEQPEGFIKKNQEDKVCKLSKALYGLKQGSHAWNEKLNDKLTQMNFQRSDADEGLYILRETSGEILAIIGTYVDDMILMTKNKKLKRRIISQLHQEFKIRDLGPVKRILGINVKRDRQRKEITIDQQEYIESLLDRFNMKDCNPVATPLDVNQNLDNSMSPKTHQEKMQMKQTPYRELLGCLMFAYQGTRPDLGSVISTLGAFAENPGPAHWNALKRVLRYLKGTKNHKLKFSKEEGSILTGYCDANWAGDLDSRKSTSGHVFTLNGGAIAWSSKKQKTVSLSSTESEYISLSSACQQALWLKNLLSDIDKSCVELPIKIHCDNQSAIKLAQSCSPKARTKHIDTKLKFVNDNIKKKIIDVVYLSSENMPADSLTKAVTKDKNAYCNKMFGMTY